MPYTKPSPRKSLAGAAITLMVAALLTAPRPMLAADERVAHENEAVKDFEKRVQDYVKMRKPLVKQLPSRKPTKVSEDILTHQRALAESLRSARKDSKQGDIFTPEITAEFRRLIAQTMKGSEAHRIRQSLLHADPVTLSLHVNDEYPAKAPLQSTPPTMLLSLPKLPKDLDYRVIGRALALRDCDADIIVDFIPDLLPAS